jgi:hypothetical protein
MPEHAPEDTPGVVVEQVQVGDLDAVTAGEADVR